MVLRGKVGVLFRKWLVNIAGRRPFVCFGWFHLMRWGYKSPMIWDNRSWGWSMFLVFTGPINQYPDADVCLRLLQIHTRINALITLSAWGVQWCHEDDQPGILVLFPFRTRGRSTSLRFTPTPARPSATTVALCSTASYTRAWDVNVWAPV